MNNSGRKPCHDSQYARTRRCLEVPYRVRIPVSHLSIPTAQPNWQLWFAEKPHIITNYDPPIAYSSTIPRGNPQNSGAYMHLPKPATIYPGWSRRPPVSRLSPSIIAHHHIHRQSRTQYLAGSCNISCIMWSVGMIGGVGKVLAFA